jgi:phosphoenolpyruvate carboxykinase (ATP)
MSENKSTHDLREGMIQESLEKGLGTLHPSGTLMVETGEFTGRAAKNRYFVRHPEVENQIAWGAANLDVTPETAEKIEKGIQAFLKEQKNYTYEGYVGGLSIQVTSNSPWHIAFAGNMFRQEPCETLAKALAGVRGIQTFHAPEAKARDFAPEMESDTAIIVDPVQMKVFIMGTAYAGEIKKSAFTLCNFILPEKGILPMHSSANCFADGSNSGVLFGLSGTGKTTLSADPHRALIGDDEIVWSPTGLSNLEGGCYAKLIDLDSEKEPEIYRAVHQRGAIAENVVFDAETRQIDFKDVSITENTRGSYDIKALSNVFDQNKEADAPRTIVFLTADAFGALPAVAKLNPYQAQYHFISGYTAKVAGTEAGVSEPQAAFSACFGAPFMPRPAAVYAKMLAEFAARNDATVWLLNTGWTEGGYGKGPRFPIGVSRRLLTAIQMGELENAQMETHPIFGFQVPTACPGVDSKLLSIPEGAHVEDLARKFIQNFEKHAYSVDPEVLRAGGPRGGEEISSGAGFADPHAEQSL